LVSIESKHEAFSTQERFLPKPVIHGFFLEEENRGSSLTADSYVPLYALPTFTPRNLAGAAPWPVPITCCGCPLPQFGVPHKVHWSREQIASIEFQNPVVNPLYEGFFSIRTRLPFFISQPISVPN
jgi:hypothetical protein